MKYLCSTSFGLHDIDAHDFYKWAKKKEENSTIKCLFLSIDDYVRSESEIFVKFNRRGVRGWGWGTR